MPDTETIPDDSKRCTLFDAPRRFCQRCSEFHTAADWLDTCERYAGSKPIRACKTCGGWHALDRWSGNCLPEPNWNRSELSSPQVIRDTLENVTHPITGKLVDSKRALRADYKRRGVEEVGNEEQKTVTREPSERQIAADVKKTLEILKSDNLSNDQMTNMLRAPAPVVHGITVA